jgi:hypothetical protein
VKRVAAVLVWTLLGLVVGLVVYFVGLVFFPGVISGEAALTYADGKVPFWDRTDWWDAVPVGIAAHRWPACAACHAWPAWGVSLGVAGDEPRDQATHEVESMPIYHPEPGDAAPETVRRQSYHSFACGILHFGPVAL